METKNDSGAEQYVSLRSEWNRYITLLAPGSPWTWTRWIRQWRR